MTSWPPTSKLSMRPYGPPSSRSYPRDTQRLIVSPDGQLNFVSLATLLTPQSQFLGEKFKIQYVASGRELLEEKPSSSQARRGFVRDP